MTSGSVPKPFLDVWLRRTRKQMLGSGRLTELSLILSKISDGDIELDPDEWRCKLQRILQGEEIPGFEILTLIDSVLARPARVSESVEISKDLFS